MLVVKKEGVKVVAKNLDRGHELSGEIVRMHLGDFMVELAVCKYIEGDAVFEIKNIEIGSGGVPVVTIKTESDTYRVPIWGSILIGGVYVLVKPTKSSE
ncbi:MAG: hypothetical protein JHC31_09610 [Sulfurihydrogenibium sp.]|jgi:hypothetical protein|nr:hypothetical protein [Sulfurihydrogenibium sp.]